ncbi:uncharacterized protein npdc1b isoform X2 [Siniperca chuatsi]|uniref:uncharacterized protein npdc1b isoform X2 n=1 Tax=Siniperca chuatsi TaxID=119488 RepID=UPI001CE02FF7|nr:uncharacterized protein npdc1b isoform X2 [Siniperca chuatsi]
MRAPLLGQAVVCAALLALSTCLTGSHLCPRSLDCARAGRHFCEPGSAQCGPCLRPLVENSHGRCVVKRRHVLHSAQSVKDLCAAGDHFLVPRSSDSSLSLSVSSPDQPSLQPRQPVQNPLPWSPLNAPPSSLRPVRSNSPYYNALRQTRRDLLIFPHNKTVQTLISSVRVSCFWVPSSFHITERSGQHGPSRHSPGGRSPPPGDNRPRDSSGTTRADDPYPRRQQSGHVDPAHAVDSVGVQTRHPTLRYNLDSVSVARATSGVSGDAPYSSLPGIPRHRSRSFLR